MVYEDKPQAYLTARLWNRSRSQQAYVTRFLSRGFDWTGTDLHSSWGNSSHLPDPYLKQAQRICKRHRGRYGIEPR
jgi:hypothetical protein